MGSNTLPSPCSCLCLEVLLLERPIVSDGWTGVDSKKICGERGFWSRASHWHVWGEGFISIVPFLARNSKGRAVSTVWVTVVTTKWGLGPVHTGKQGLDAFFTYVMVAIFTGFPCRAVLMPSADESGSFPHPSGLLAFEAPTGPIVSLRMLSSGEVPSAVCCHCAHGFSPCPQGKAIRAALWVPLFCSMSLASLWPLSPRPLLLPLLV